MGKLSRIRSLFRETDETNATVAEFRALMPAIQELLALRVNLDRLGPRLELIDSISPRLELIDSISPRLDAIERLTESVRLLADAVANIEGLSKLAGEANSVLNKFLDANHVVAEDVRLDVDTISAVTLSLQKSMNELTDRLTTIAGELPAQ